jgi:hypothetical protein
MLPRRGHARNRAALPGDAVARRGPAGVLYQRGERHGLTKCRRHCHGESGSLSFRDVEDLLPERGIMVSYETVRRWVNHFGPVIFQLVPWTPSLEKQLGRHVSGVARGDGGIDWGFGRNRGLAL